MTDAPLIWGFDVSKSRTGVAWGRADGKPSVAHIGGDKGESAGRAGTRLFVHMRDLLAFGRPAAIYYERRLEHGFKPEIDWDAKTVKQNRGILAALDIAAMCQVVEIFAGLASIPVSNVAPSTARKNFVGDGKLDRKAAKLRVRTMCAMLGWKTENDDEGDACCIWHFGTCVSAPRLAAVIHPGMFAKAATLAAEKGAGRLADPSEDMPW